MLGGPAAAPLRGVRKRAIPRLSPSSLRDSISPMRLPSRRLQRKTDQVPYPSVVTSSTSFPAKNRRAFLFEGFDAFGKILAARSLVLESRLHLQGLEQPGFQRLVHAPLRPSHRPGRQLSELLSPGSRLLPEDPGRLQPGLPGLAPGCAEQAAGCPGWPARTRDQTPGDEPGTSLRRNRRPSRSGRRPRAGPLRRT